MSLENITALQNGYAAFSRGDMPAVFAIFDPTIEWDTPTSVPGGGVHVGYDGVGKFFAGLADRYQRLEVSPEQFLDAEDHIVVTGRLSGAGMRGTTFDIGFAHVWTVKAGLALRITEYLDSAELAAAIN
jgi:ketosteroid isomerase-like protein